MDLETEIMEIIINAGESKSEAMLALQFAKKGEWDKVDSSLALPKEASLRAHLQQTKLIGLDEGTGKVPVSLVMVHAQDHLMTSMLAVELISELIELYKKN